MSKMTDEEVVAKAAELSRRVNMLLDDVDAAIEVMGGRNAQCERVQPRVELICKLLPDNNADNLLVVATLVAASASEFHQSSGGDPHDYVGAVLKTVNAMISGVNQEKH